MALHSVIVERTPRKCTIKPRGPIAPLRFALHGRGCSFQVKAAIIGLADAKGSSRQAIAKVRANARAVLHFLRTAGWRAGEAASGA